MKTSVLPSLSWNPESGAMQVGGSRYLLVRPATVVALLKAAEEMHGIDSARALFIAAGTAGGSEAATEYAKADPDPRVVAATMAQKGTGIGWGKIRVEHAELNGTEIRFSVESSPFAEEYGRTDHSVCHFLTGALSGLGRVVFGADAVGEETACLSNGAERCEFRIARAPSGS